MTSASSWGEFVAEVGLDPRPWHLAGNVFSSPLEKTIFLLLIGLLGVPGRRDPSGLPLDFKSFTAGNGTYCDVPEISEESPSAL